MLTIQTANTRVARTKKQQRGLEDDDYGDESDEMPDEEATEHVERRFNFVSELAYLVDYAVVDKYVMLLRHTSHYEKKAVDEKGNDEPLQTCRLLGQADVDILPAGHDGCDH